MNVDEIIRIAKQPSTLRGLFLFLGALGVAVSPEAQHQIIVLVSSLLGLLEIVRDEDAPIVVVLERTDDDKTDEEPQ